MSDHPFGWWSLLPPVVAIVMAIATRRVIASLLVGVFVGASIIARGHPVTAIAAALETHLWGSLSDGDHLRVFAFTLLMGAMVGVMGRAGGMRAVVDALAPLARSRTGGQLVTWLLGLIIFFDDYANSLLLGNTMRPLADRLKISREKLAYLVDSTAAPVSGLAIVSTWVAGEIGFIVAGYEDLKLPGVAIDGFGVFVETIPFRFYVLWTLLFVPLVALTGREFGPMLHAERRSRGKSKRADAVASAAPELAAPSGDDVDPLPAGHAPKHLWINSIAPVLIMIAVTVVLLLITGAEKLGEQPHIEPTWFNRFGHGDSYLALVYGSLAGLLAAMLLAWLQRVLPWRKLRAAAFEGARLVLPALTILWLAWALSGLTREQYLGTGTFLGGILTKVVIPQWMPTIVFVLSSLVAFATGTSWGTMGILMPLAISVTYKMLASQQSEVDLHDPLLLASIGSVLAGAIFGDHCSPISDTTILSSQASGCPHMDHVWTQLPYALLVALISILCGTLPAGFGVGVWILVPLGVIVLFVCLLVMGRPVEMKPPPNSI